MAHITITQLNTILSRIVTWVTGKFAAKNVTSGKLEYSDMPVVVLASMGHELDGTDNDISVSVGDTYFLPAGSGTTPRIMYRPDSGNPVRISDPVSGVIYCNAYTGLLYRWDTSQAKMVSVGGTSGGSIDVSGKADMLAGTNMLTPSQWPKTVLRNVTDSQLDDLASDDVYFDSGHLYLYKGENQNPVDLNTPSSKIIYFCLADGKMYRWVSNSFQPVLSAVATSGSYNDLSNKPTIPTKISDLTDDSGFLDDEAVDNAIDTALNNYYDKSTINSTFATKLQVEQDLERKQDTLTSSTTLMTINGNAVHYGESVTVQGEKGDKGDTGNVQVDGNGNVLIYNGLDKTTTGAALDASQGQFIGKLLNAKDSTFYNVWVGTAAELEALDGDYDDNTIYLVGTVATVAQRFNVSFDGGDHTSIPANTPETVKEGSAFSVVVSPASGYTIDSATGTMAGGGTLTKTENQDGTVTFSTTSVTGAISIQAAATIHITGITVSAGTRTNNSIPLTAAVAPSGAENVTLAWSISEDGTNYSNSTTHFGISSNGVLTVKEGADNASVTVKCADTNASSGTASGTLQLTDLSYEETPIPITEITDISATRTAANTLTLDAVTDPVDANTPAVSFSLVGNVPTVKQVRRWAAGDTVDGEVKESAGNDLIELPAVELNGDTLTYKEDCQVTVRATAGSVTHDETIDIVHDNADAIWFEDSVAVTLLNAKNIGSGGKVTYSQAATPTTLRINGHTFAGNTNVRRFKEFMYFTGCTSLGAYATSFIGCSNLECIGIPPVTVSVKGTTPSENPFYGCKLKEVHVKSLADYKLGLSANYSGMCYAGKSSEGMGLFIDGEEVRDIVIPEGLAVTAKYSGFRFTSFTAEYITNFPVGSLYGCTSLVSLKIGNDVTTIGEKAFGADGYAPTNLQNVDLGSGISALGAQCFRGCTGLKSLTLRYNGKVTHNNSFINATSALAAIKLYVPSGQVDTYKADTSYWNTVNDNNIIAITE